jgi:hypothetical protein
MVGQVSGCDNQRNFNNIFWYRQKVVNQIIELNTENPDIDDNVEEDTLNPLFLPQLIKTKGTHLFQSAIMLFGGWKNALRVAGLNEKTEDELNVLNNDYWDQDKIIEQIQLLFNYKFDLTAGFIRVVYPELYNAALKKDNFGSWAKALDEAELDFRCLHHNTRTFWTISRIMRTIIDYEDCYGNIQPEAIRNLNPSLYIRAHRYFKSWSGTVQRAGLNLIKNKIKVHLEPFRDYLVKQYLSKIFEKLQIPVKSMEDLEFENHLQLQNSNNGPEKVQIPKNASFKQTNSVLLVNEGKELKYILPKFRSWSVGLENSIENVLKKYPNITIYHSIGEPRQWVDNNVEFENINKFYRELMSNGRDDLISELSLISRGGVPKQYQEQFEEVMAEIRKQIKN